MSTRSERTCRGCRSNAAVDPERLRARLRLHGEIRHPRRDRWRLGRGRCGRAAHTRLLAAAWRPIRRRVRVAEGRFTVDRPPGRMTASTNARDGPQVAGPDEPHDAAEAPADEREGEAGRVHL